MEDWLLDNDHVVLPGKTGQQMLRTLENEIPTQVRKHDQAESVDRLRVGESNTHIFEQNISPCFETITAKHVPRSITFLWFAKCRYLHEAVSVSLNTEREMCSSGATECTTSVQMKNEFVL